MMNLINAVLATEPTLPPIASMFEYVVAGNGLFVRAGDSRMEALVPVAEASLRGLADLNPYARLKVARVPAVWLEAVLASARRHLPQEVLYQFCWADAKWKCTRPQQAVNSVSVAFDDSPEAVIDLHSHNSMPAFFSSTDNSDEQGLRFYCVIGRIDTDTPEIACRAGVYGHHWPVPADTIFESAGPFVDVALEEQSKVPGRGSEQQ